MSTDFNDRTAILKTETFSATPAAGQNRQPTVVALTGSQAGRLYRIQKDELVIGRQVEAQIHVDDDGVSRRHARLLRGADGSIDLEDLGSTNGTFCNGERVTRTTLKDGDKIQVGTATILKFGYQDVVEQEFQRKQYESVTKDSLTGCFNKKYLSQRLPSEVAFHQRHKKPLTVAMLDVDHFKAVNDTHGHPVGDAVLRQVAHTIQESIRADDVLARYGGEEFVVLMRETTADHAFVAAERIRRRIEAARVQAGEKELTITVSIGLATSTTVQGGHEDLLRVADEFLYKAKRGGRNRTESELLA